MIAVQENNLCVFLHQISCCACFQFQLTWWFANLDPFIGYLKHVKSEYFLNPISVADCMIQEQSMNHYDDKDFTYKQFNINE